ncbi:unnamed protein product [Caenorhabditis nigoni]
MQNENDQRDLPMFRLNPELSPNTTHKALEKAKKDIDIMSKRLDDSLKLYETDADGNKTIDDELRRGCDHYVMIAVHQLYGAANTLEDVIVEWGPPDQAVPLGPPDQPENRVVFLDGENDEDEELEEDEWIDVPEEGEENGNDGNGHN